MRAKAVLLVILMLSSIQASLAQDAFLVRLPDIGGTSSGADCSNQTHSGGAFHANAGMGDDSWAGTSDCPTATIHAAVDLASQGGTV